jgi:NADPH-dependent 2,4-dienoyl-CoA reductase/sulfur reductase-like enzyme/rhodanese-related sulfurtransferase
MKVIVIGGVAAGPKAAAKIMRLDPEAQVTILEKGEHISFAGCGLPYYLSETVKDQKALMSTPIGVVRDAGFFAKVKNVQVHTGSQAMEIDRQHKRVRVRRNAGEEAWLDYDKLLLATGASPVIPPIPNITLRNINTLHNISDAERIKASLGSGNGRRAVIVGGGLIGVETAEALVARGYEVTMVEMMPQILRMLDQEMAQLVELHMKAHGVKILTNTRVTAFEGSDSVTTVVTDKGSVPADLVIIGIGVRPNSELARAAGLEIGPTGGIKVDKQMRTSDQDIYAAGDCVESTDLLTGKPCFIPMGSTANKQGRVAAMNICGVQDSFPGVLGSAVCRVFEYCVARTGLTESAARQLGYAVTTVWVPDADRPHYMPSAKPLIIKLIVNSTTRELLGAQAVGPGEGDKRMNVAAMAITGRMTVDHLAQADLCYAPPFSPAVDNIITAANVCRNKLDGQMVGITAAQVKARLKTDAKPLLLDVRSPAEYAQNHIPGSTLIPLGALRARLNELPKDREIITFCKVSLRGYEAARILQGAGFPRVQVMDGGITMWPYETTITAD